MQGSVPSSAPVLRRGFEVPFDVGDALRMFLDLVFQISAPIEMESHVSRAKNSRNAAGSEDPIDDGV